MKAQGKLASSPPLAATFATEYAAPSHVGGRAASRRRQRAAKAATATTSEDAVLVNVGSDVSLRERLAKVKQLPACVVERAS